MRTWLLASVAVMAMATHARASEGETWLLTGANYSFARFDEDNLLHGGGGRLDYLKGWNERWWYGASAGGSLYSTLDYDAHLTVGAVYVFDVLKYVPSARFGAGGALLHHPQDGLRVAPLAEIEFGIDKIGRSDRTVGVFARGQTSFGQYHTVTAGIRIGWRWGFF